MVVVLGGRSRTVGLHVNPKLSAVQSKIWVRSTSSWRLLHKAAKLSRSPVKQAKVTFARSSLRSWLNATVPMVSQWPATTSFLPGYIWLKRNTPATRPTVVNTRFPSGCSRGSSPTGSRTQLLVRNRASCISANVTSLSAAAVVRSSISARAAHVGYSSAPSPEVSPGGSGCTPMSSSKKKNSTRRLRCSLVCSTAESVFSGTGKAEPQPCDDRTIIGQSRTIEIHVVTDQLCSAGGTQGGVRRARENDAFLVPDRR